jgi:anaerobic magnesium-protoporphyrin IX monomethyl ester cyclase
MGKVLLVYPYFLTGIVMDQLFPPIGISLLSAVLKQKGIEVMKLDCTFLSMSEAISKAAAFQPDVVGIYVMSTLASHAVNILEQLRLALPGSLYTAGGPLPTLYPARFAKKFDFVFRGEATGSFPDFCRDYLTAVNKEDFMYSLLSSAYPGLYSSQSGRINTPAVHLTETAIDACPLPDRQGFDHARYQQLSYEFSGRKKSSIMTTYGCPYNCDFCSKPIFGSQLRFRSLDRIFAEIDDILSFGYDSLWIADDLFTYSTEFLTSFCQRLMSDHLPVSWSCLSRVDCITGDLARMMKTAGCHKVYLGIESGNDNVLKLMNKKTDTAAIRSAVRIFTGHGIRCAGFFLVGYPGETTATIEETFDFALSLGLDEISFNVPYPLPGSKLYERVSGIREDDWSFENETRFLYESEFNEEWLRKRIRETIGQFEAVK